MNKTILFEWRLIARNRRLKQMLIVILFLTGNAYLLFLSSNFIIVDYFIWRLFFLIALFSVAGMYYGVSSLSISASFIERLMISPMPLSYSLRAKYYLYCILSTVIALLMLPVLAIGISLMEIVSSYLFSVGFMYFACFQFVVYNYVPIDIKATSFYNWQGFDSSTQLLAPIVICSAALGFIAAANWLLGEKATLLMISVVGGCFIVTHKLWIKSVCRRVEKTKYYRLSCFRENRC